MVEPLPAGATLKLPERVGRYRVLCELGQGSMATLYLGRASGIGGFERLFALKAVHEHLSRKPAFIDMFLNEARIAASVHHPNVVQVYEVDVDDGQYFLAMDYVSGETLAMLLRSTWNEGRELSARFGAYIIAAIAEGLHAAHELVDADGEPRNVVHRDVAPQNVLIGYDGIPRITDFGIAKALDTVSQTRPGVMKGTVAYMAPEQVRCQDIDRRADTFALGVMLWEATLGMRLFKGANDVMTASRILKLHVPAPSSIRSDYPKQLEEIIMKALRRPLEERYQNARDLSKDLLAFLAGDNLTTPAEIQSLMKDVFAERLQQRRALERDARASEPPKEIQNHLQSTSHTMGLEAVVPIDGSDEMTEEEEQQLLDALASRVGPVSTTPSGGTAVPEKTSSMRPPDPKADAEAKTSDKADTEPAPIPAVDQRTVSTMVIREVTHPTKGTPVPVLQVVPDPPSPEIRITPVLPEDDVETREPTKLVDNPLNHPKPEPEVEDPEPTFFDSDTTKHPDLDEEAPAEDQGRKRLAAIAVATIAAVIGLGLFLTEPDATPNEVEAAAPEKVAPPPSVATAPPPAPPPPAPPPAAPPEPELVAPTPPPELIRIAVQVDPPGATMTFDGNPFDGSIEVEKDPDAHHVLRIQAPGYEPLTKILDAGSDQGIALELKPNRLTPKKTRKTTRRRKKRVEPKKTTKPPSVLFEGSDL